MPKTSRTSKPSRTAQELLVEKHDYYNSWALVSEELGGINRGLLSAIASGNKKAPPSVLAALGLPIDVLVRASVCRECGTPHVKEVKCPTKRKPRGPRRNWKKAYTWAASMVLFMAEQK